MDFFRNYAIRDYRKPSKPRDLPMIVIDMIPALIVAALAVWIFGAPG